MRVATRWLPILTIAIMLGLAAPVSAGYYEEEYTTSGTVEDPTATSQAGVLKCGGSLTAIGGVCVPFPQKGDGQLNTTWEGVYITVEDFGPSSHRIPAQVCMDNDGDGRCVADPDAECGDRIWSNHRDDGTFATAIGPLPVSFPEGCDGSGDVGYYVIICEGVHAPGGLASSSHTHPATKGRVEAYINDLREPTEGDFCTGGGAGTAVLPIPFGVPTAPTALLLVGVALLWQARRRS